MEISPYFLTLLVLYSFLFGVGVGILNDLHRLTRIFFGVRYSQRSFGKLYGLRLPLLNRTVGELGEGRLRRRLLPILLFFQDLLLFVVAALGVAVLNYYFNDGRFRIYTVAALLAGFLLYYFTLGRLVMLLSEGIVCLWRILWAMVLFLVSRPFVLLWRLIARLGKKIGGKIGEALANHRKRVYNKRTVHRILEEATEGFLPEGLPGEKKRGENRRRHEAEKLF